jgi:ubiquinone/menaquinone biosynthesis C-methylase UbiE
VTSTFDITAAKFEQYRALPAGVPQAIREAIWKVTGLHRSALVLDMGAGSGRIGRAFVEAGDSYVGVDFSLPMLREFHAKDSAACLMQVDGACLPFVDGCFELVLLMQVLSGTHNWHNLLSETTRVIVPGGFVIVGQTVTPATGVDEQMKKQLSQILKAIGAASHDSKKSRDQSLEWLRAGSSQRIQLTAASWTTMRTAQDFLDRHRHGARFASLPLAVQEEALQKLSAWGEKTWGSLDKVFTQEHKFELQVFKTGSTYWFSETAS